MKNSSIKIALLFLAAVGAVIVSLQAQSATPRINAVEPASGAVGDVLTITGENLDQGSVAALYLTDGKADIKVVITEHTATSMKFKVPPVPHAGRFALMVLTKDQEPRLIEQPVKVTIEPPTGE